MTTAEKATVVFQSGLAFRITNKPVQDDQLWDVRIFWAHMEYDGETVYKECDIKGFADIDDCLDNCLLYLKNYRGDEGSNTDIPIGNSNTTR